MAIVGGGNPWIVGKTAIDQCQVLRRVIYGQGIHYALIVATLCYLYILFFV